MKTHTIEQQTTDMYALLPTVEGKSPERVDNTYLKYPEEWKNQYDMLLMDGDTCGDCVHSERCKMLFDGNDNNTCCQFNLNRFTRKIPYK